ncbi:MAG: HAMP domain-containing sensor histidine kinase [Bacteroidota bacterium]
MSIPSDLRTMALAAVGLGVLLVGIAVVQEASISGWSEVEDIRLRSSLVEGARQLDADLTERIAATGEPFIELAAQSDGIANTLVDRLDQLPPHALPIRNVYWVTPGMPPTLLRLTPDAKTLAPVSWQALGTEWQRYFSREGTPLRQGSPLEVSNADTPAHALAFPALPTPDAPVPYVVLALDSTALATSVLPSLLRDHLGLGETFDITIGPEGEPPVYTSRPGLTTLPHPDLVQPIGARLLTALTLTLTRDEGQAALNVNAGELTSGDALWEMRIQHRAGSIGAAASRLRWQQRALAFAVLALLAGAVALLIRSVLAQRALAQRQLAFVAGVTHELRTPLSVLHAAGENLSDGVVDDPEAARRYGTLVRDESRRLADMVETVLTYAGAEAPTVRRAPILIADWVEDAVEQARPALDETGTTLTLDLAPDLPPVHGDTVALATALRNLIANAARHGGPSVQISARATQGGSRIELAVSDDGPGIPPANREALFEPFVRGAAAIEAQTPGSGLGLALVRRIVEAHNGTVELAETPKTTFILTLPASS